MSPSTLEEGMPQYLPLEADLSATFCRGLGGRERGGVNTSPNLSKPSQTSRAQADAAGVAGRWEVGRGANRGAGRWEVGGRGAGDGGAAVGVPAVNDDAARWWGAGWGHGIAGEE